jgi:MSHA biogenesis protein MshN
MSVINQMLQELDKRQHQSPEPVVIGSANHSTQSVNKILLGIVIVLLIATISLALIWFFQRPEGLGVFAQSSPSIVGTSNRQSGNDSDHATTSKTQSTTEIEYVSSAHSSIESNQNVSNPSIEKAKHKDISVIDAEIKTQELKKRDVTEVLVAAPSVKEVEVAGQQSQQKPPDAGLNSRSATTQLPTDKHLTQLVEELKQKDSVSSTQTRNNKSRARNNNIQAKKDQGSMSLEPVVLSKAQLVQKKSLQLEKAKIAENMPLALQLARELYQLSPRDVNGIKEYAALLYASGELSLAEDLLKSSLAHDDESASLRLMLAKYYYHNNDGLSAIRTLSGYSGPAANALDLVSFRAALYQKSKNAQQAYNDYRRLVAVNANQGAWMLGLAITSEQVGQVNDALRAYQHARQIGGLSAASKQFIESRISALGGQ